MREAFIDHAFRGKALRQIEQANEIIAEYQAQGFKLTLRQLYYQFVARDLLANQQKNYKALGNLLSKARLAGEVDWDAFEDRTRTLRKPVFWDTPEDIMSAVAHQYKEGVWADQPRFVVVLEEKDALLGVIEPVCNELRVPFMSCRGHMSQTEMYDLGKLLAEKAAAGQEPYVVHIGDHDPSGVHMTNDIQARLSMFAEQEIEVNRIALNMDQIRAYRPPPNPAKESDSRWAAYVRDYNTRQSWELDALAPTVLADLIREAINGVIDHDLWRAAVAKEKRNRSVLRGVYDDFEAVGRYLRFRDTEVLLEDGHYTADGILERALGESDDEIEVGDEIEDDDDV